MEAARHLRYMAHWIPTQARLGCQVGGRRVERSRGSPDAIGVERRGASRRALASVLLSRELDVHQAVRPRKGKGPQQYRLHHAVDARGGADAERERQHRDGRESRAPGERAERVAEVIHIGAPPSDPPASLGAPGGSSQGPTPRA